MRAAISANKMIAHAVKTPITAVLFAKKSLVDGLSCVRPAGLLTTAVMVRSEVPSRVKYVVVKNSGASVGEELLAASGEEELGDTDVLD